MPADRSNHDPASHKETLLRIARLCDKRAEEAEISVKN
jgi:hypothetical protein